MASKAVRLRRVASDSVLTVQRRAADLATVLRLLDRTAVDQVDDPDLHAVAWIDAAVAGQALGRGVVRTARVLAGDQARQVSRRRPGRAGRAQGARPAGPPVRAALPGPGVITAGTIRAANWGRWVTARDHRERTTGLAEALHPLDGAGSWPAAFGRQGLLQYQFVVPLEDGRRVMRGILSAIVSSGSLPFLNILKRMGKAIDKPDLEAVAKDVESRLAKIEFPIGYRAVMQGEYIELKAARGRILLFTALALGAILLLLHVAYKSWRMALMTFLTLPFALVGGVLNQLPVRGGNMKVQIRGNFGLDAPDRRVGVAP